MDRQWGGVGKGGGGMGEQIPLLSRNTIATKEEMIKHTNFGRTTEERLNQ